MAREDRLFLRYLKTSDPEALGKVFDLVAPRLLGMALHLVRDPVEAEDLLQTTFLTAIQRAGSFDRGKPLLPWLLGILTRHAVRAREKGARKPVPDRVDRAPSSDPAVKAENAELVQLLRTRMEELPEHYRQPLVLKLVHGMPPAEIAEVLKVAPGTLRMRLHRGLEKLRRILPALASLVAFRPLRGLDAVRRSVVQGAARSAVVPVAAHVLFKKVLIPVVVAAGLAALWLSCPGLLMGASGPEPGAVPGPLVVDLEEQVQEGAEETASLARTSLPATVAESPTNTGSLLVRVVQAESREPRSKVGVFWVPLDGTDPVFHDKRGATGEDGTLLVENLPPGPVEVKLDRSVASTVQIEEGKQTDCVLEIPVGITVRGRVVDQMGGPVPHARIWVGLQTRDFPTGVVTHANAFGEFELEDMTYYSWVGAAAPGHAPSYMHPVGLGESGDVVEMEISLEGPGAILEGRVLDGAGQPVPDALVLVGMDFGGRHKQLENGITLSGPCARRLRTDEEGRFATEGLPGGWNLLTVRAPGKAPFSDDFELEASRVNAVEIQLREGVEVRGSVLDPDGRPVSGASVGVESFGGYEEASTRSAADGSFHLQGLSSERIKIGASAAGFARASETLDLSLGHELRWDVQLTHEGVLRGRLLDTGGEPLEKWLVNLSGSRMVACDAEGRFSIPFKGKEPQLLRLTSPERGGWVVCDWLGLLLPNRDPEELVVRVPDRAMPRSWIRGVLLDANGSPPASSGLAYAERDSLNRLFGIDPETGAFEIGPIPSGAYWIKAGGGVTRPSALLGPFQVFNGQDLDLGETRLPETGSVRVVIRRRDGVPLEEPYVYINEPEGRWMVTNPRALDDGTFHTVLLPGKYEAEVLVSNATWKTLPFEVVSGEETEVSMVLEPADRKYVMFPYPVPEDWGKPKSVRAVIRGATGGLVHETEYEPDDGGAVPAYTHPFRYAPALGVGFHTLELILDDGRRYRGRFEVPSLDPSPVPIRISVTPIR